MTRSRLSRSNAAVFGIKGAFPHGSNITLRGNTMAALGVSHLFNVRPLTLTKSSVLVLADNSISVSSDFAEYVWYQDDSLTITDHSHYRWENNSVIMTKIIWYRIVRIYGVYIGSKLTLSGGSSFVLRGNTMEWGSNRIDGTNVSLLYCTSINTIDATVTIADNALTTTDKATLQYLWEVNSDSSSSVSSPFTLYMCGNTWNGTVLSVVDSHITQWLTQLLGRFLSSQCTQTQPLAQSPERTRRITTTVWLTPSHSHPSTVSGLC